MPQATSIELTDVRSPAMRVFHLSWLGFFASFFGWFAIAPLMPVVRDEFGLTQAQVGDTIVASVALTVVARVVVGALCDRVGPRRTYAGLMVFGAVALVGLALAQDYTTFLLGRLALGVVGASFVVTQYHCTVWFAPSVVGAANATTAGWGNLGGGAAHLVMPALVAGLVWVGIEPNVGWRLALLVPALALITLAPLYLRWTEDRPQGTAAAPRVGDIKATLGALADHRVVFLAGVYACCFGVELTVHNIAALYFVDRFGLSVGAAGAAAASFGLMNLFARSLGGWASDRVGEGGLQGRLVLLAGLMVLEGGFLLAFTRSDTLGFALVLLVTFSLFVQMAEGATFGVVPFVRPDALGGVLGAVASGGPVGAVVFGLLFGLEWLAWADALAVVGVAAVLSAAPVGFMAWRYDGSAEADAQ
jgi:MFS transporter, NNP family, nitrate/nitrite transporter